MVIYNLPPSRSTGIPYRILLFVSLSRIPVESSQEFNKEFFNNTIIDLIGVVVNNVLPRIDRVGLKCG